MVRPYRDEDEDFGVQCCYCSMPVYWQGSYHTGHSFPLSTAASNQFSLAQISSYYNLSPQVIPANNNVSTSTQTSEEEDEDRSLREEEGLVAPGVYNFQTFSRILKTNISEDIAMTDMNDAQPEASSEVAISLDSTALTLQPDIQDNRYTNRESFLPILQNDNLKSNSQQQPGTEMFANDDILEIPIYIPITDIDDDESAQLSLDLLDGRYQQSNTETVYLHTTSESKLKRMADNDVIEICTDFPMTEINDDEPKVLKMYTAVNKYQESLVSSSQPHNLKPTGQQQPGIEYFPDDDILEIPIYIPMSDIDDDECQHFSSDEADSTGNGSMLLSTQTHNLRTTSEQQQKTENLTNNVNTEISMDIPITEISDDVLKEFKIDVAVNTDQESLVSSSRTHNLNSTAQQRQITEDLVNRDLLEIPKTDIDDDEHYSSDVVDSTDHEFILSNTQTDNQQMTSEQQTEDSANDHVIEIPIGTAATDSSDDEGFSSEERVSIDRVSVSTSSNKLHKGYETKTKYTKSLKRKRTNTCKSNKKMRSSCEK